MSGSRLSPREHLLLLVAVAVACGMGYWLIRGRILARDISSARAATKTVRTKLEGFEAGGGEFTDPALLITQLEKARAELSAAQNALDELEQRFVDLDYPVQVDRLRLEISALADASGVVIRENRTCPAAQVHRTETSDQGVVRPRAKDEVVALLAGGEPYRRPLREITVQSSYEGLLRFLKGLSDLPSFVGVIRFAVEIDGESDSAAGPVLKTTLVLVF